MIPFDVLEKLSPEEHQALRDNKGSYLLQIIYKCCKIVYQTQEYLEHIDQDMCEDKLVYHKGKKRGSFEVFNFIKSQANFEKQKAQVSPEEKMQADLELAKEQLAKLRKSPNKV